MTVCGSNRHRSKKHHYYDRQLQIQLNINEYPLQQIDKSVLNYC